MQRAFKKINERLEKKLNNLKHNQQLFKDRNDLTMKQVCESESVAYQNAIEIVNQVASEYGGEVCEWKGKDKLGLYNSACKQRSIVNPFWTHCPYCGKKIKIVEDFNSSKVSDDILKEIRRIDKMTQERMSEQYKAESEE